jgi:hypothetical protein
MPYKDPEKRKEAQRNSMAKLRGSQEQGSQTTGSQNVISEPHLDDWSNRRNYSEAYLNAMDEQSGVLTEKSRVAMKSWLPDPETLVAFWKNYGTISGIIFTPNKLR